ncbi:MAG: hypothetical protein HDQ97_09595 [Lachnospiraceae bacterium]|nr:hypothetical protein [Lachnospiraceae bacterium]
MRKIILIVIMWGLANVYGGKIEMEQKESGFCSISDFKDFNYYLYCDNAINNETWTSVHHEYAIWGKDVETIDKGKELYQEFKGQCLPKELLGNIDINYVSPDCKWIIAQEFTDDVIDDLRRQTLLYEGKKITETQDTYEIFNPVIIVKRGDAYEQMDNQIHQKLVELRKRCFVEGWQQIPIINEQGNLVLCAAFDGQIAIRKIEDGATIWNFSFESMMDTCNRVGFSLVWFSGNQEEGKIIIEYDRDFYEISYPSGYVKYLGQDMYSLSYSPDGKYVAYSSGYHEIVLAHDGNIDELEQILPGIYILEVATGKTAYIKQDIDICELSERSFLWIEEEDFERSMEK